MKVIEAFERYANAALREDVRYLREDIFYESPDDVPTIYDALKDLDGRYGDKYDEMRASPSTLRSLRQIWIATGTARPMTVDEWRRRRPYGYGPPTWFKFDGQRYVFTRWPPQ
jgi:hypothetical protein